MKAVKGRLEYFAAAPEGMKAMLALEHHVRNSGLEHSLIHLVPETVSIDLSTRTHAPVSTQR